MKKSVTFLAMASLIALQPQLSLNAKAETNEPVLMEDAYWTNGTKVSTEELNYVGTSGDIEFGELNSAIKFNLGSSGSISKATLRIYINEIINADTDPENTDEYIPSLTLYGVTSDASWSVSDMPVPDPLPLVNEETNLSLGWNEFDVTEFVQNQLVGDKVATFFLTGSEVPGLLFSYSSDDYADPNFRPQLKLEIQAQAEQPTVLGTTIQEDTLSSNGLIISPSESGATTTHFKITDITGGTLFKNDGTTVINNNDFITLAEGASGLKLG